MSYILDALRKSDQQRHRGSSPTLLTAHDLPVAASRPTIILYGVLAVIVLVVGVAIGALRPWQHYASVATVTPVPAAPSAQPALPPPIVVAPSSVATLRSDVEPVVRNEVPAARPEPATRAPNTDLRPVTPRPAPAADLLARTPPHITLTPAPPAPASVAPAGNALASTVVTGPAPTPAAQPAAAIPPATAPRESAIVAYSELPFAVQQEIPRLTIAVHAYSKEPKSRLVTIDNRLLHEGDDAAPGLKIEQITPDGMIFSYKGFRFRRSVQEIVNNR